MIARVRVIVRPVKVETNEKEAANPCSLSLSSILGLDDESHLIAAMMPPAIVVMVTAIVMLSDLDNCPIGGAQRSCRGHGRRRHGWREQTSTAGKSDDKKPFQYGQFGASPVCGRSAMWQMHLLIINPVSKS